MGKGRRSRHRGPRRAPPGFVMPASIAGVFDVSATGIVVPEDEAEAIGALANDDPDDDGDCLTVHEMQKSIIALFSVLVIRHCNLGTADDWSRVRAAVARRAQPALDSIVTHHGGRIFFSGEYASTLQWFHTTYFDLLFPVVVTDVGGSL